MGFLSLGAGTRSWLLEAAAAGTARMNVEMAGAVALAKISGTAKVNTALGEAATYGRFATDDLASILDAAVCKSTTHRTDGKLRWLRALLAGRRSGTPSCP